MTDEKKQEQKREKLELVVLFKPFWTDPRLYAILTGLSTVIGVAFWIGSNFQTMQFYKERNEIIDENRVLRDSLSNSSKRTAFRAFSKTEFNSDLRDFPVMQAAVYKDAPDVNWQPYILADIGNTINLGLYYHNSGDDTARDVKFNINLVTVGQYVIATGIISCSNSDKIISGSCLIKINSQKETQLDFSQAIWQKDKTFTPVPFPNYQSGLEVFTPKGLNIGDVPPKDWFYQGVIKLSYIINEKNRLQ
jgi:hypothetical protein